MDIRDFTLLNQPSRPFIRRWCPAERAILSRYLRSLRKLHWSLESDELYHPCGDRLAIAPTGYVLWNEFGEFPDLPFMNLGQALLYLNNT